MKNLTLTLDLVRRGCMDVYDNPISDRTWRRWKRIVMIPEYAKTVTQEQAIALLTLAFMKREMPKAKLTYLKVRQRLAAYPELDNKLSQRLIDIANTFCVGTDLPDIIYQFACRRVSIRTLYRWGKKYQIPFSTEARYNHADIMRWVAIAKSA
ncbi:hypothetical protein PCC6912_40140 [Chlorogloeopsis fritschii PCC 6912]|uniref:Uncharacterized protein n=1 Tax=Chlorogloeopsis fritschii PCC 6912 TaxID=211165 RepID=A0A433N6H3_CHLFR|nr:hypothetical protein [Chlorogloeopsis fritschii]RUR77055.1 hypothetical protein PCC6912_40140 [Chlorogloeopsis fritschii PCC 6912]